MRDMVTSGDFRHIGTRIYIHGVIVSLPRKLLAWEAATNLDPARKGEVGSFGAADWPLRNRCGLQQFWQALASATV